LGRIVAAWSRKEFNTEDTERTENTEKNRDNFKKVNAETLRQAAEELG